MRRTLAAFLLIAAPAWGQAPPAPAPVFPQAVITAPAAHPGGVPLVVFGDQSVTTARLSWILISPKVPFEIADLPDHPGSVLVVRQPVAGVTYKVALVAYGNGNPAFAFDFADVPVGLAPRPPPPDPDPTPNPTPDPTPRPPNPPTPLFDGPLHAVLLYSEDDPSTRLVRVSDIRAQLKALDCGWYVVAKSHEAYAGFGPFLPPSGAPAVLILGLRDGKNEIIAKVETPTKPDQIVNAVKSLRGRN